MPVIHSFRLRLALLSALLSGLVLAVFGLTAWSLIRDLRIDRVDQDVRESAEREVRQVRTTDDWHRIERQLAASMGVHDERELLLLVADAGGGILYRSAHWSAAPVPGEFPWPALEPGARGGDRVAAPLVTAQTADARSEGVAVLPRPPSEPRPSGPPPRSGNLYRDVEGRSWRFGLAASHDARLAVGVDLAFLDDEMWGIRRAFLLAMPVAIVLVGLGAWFFSNRAMRPLLRLAEATRRISAERLDQRIPQQGEDHEFADLIEVVNGMLERLERGFHQARRFSADAAHELQTPLAILQGQLERAMAMAETGSPLQRELGSILDEVRRLSTISRKLLLLAQADAGHLRVLRENADLSRMLRDLVEDLPLLAPELTVIERIAPGLTIQADAALFPQVLHNLLSNAVKYNVEQGWIEVSASHVGDCVEVVIANSSPGTFTSGQGALFERFFRGDAAHGRTIEGVGLGLSVAREIARVHGGDLLFGAGDHGSARFTLRLPAG